MSNDKRRATWDDVRRWSAAASETAMAVVADWTPWAVAAAPALAIARGLRHHQVHGALIFVVALAVELAGVLAGHTLTEAREYNAVAARKRSIGAIVAALVAYVAIGTSLAVLLDAWPGIMAAFGVPFDLRAVWPAFLPLLAVMVYWLNGERQVIRQARSAANAAAPQRAQEPTAASAAAPQAFAPTATVPAQEPQSERTACRWCERPFETANALRAHEWRCPLKETAPVATNGNGAH